nr:putative odorant receptor 69a [Halyomorpha halys]
MRVMTKVNSLMSGLLFFEYLLTSMQCCLSGYQLLADKKNDGIAGFFYHCTFFAISVTFSSVNCYCGDIIKLKSENIFEAAYCNNWYSLSNVERKKLLVLQLASSKPLTLSYRHLITFDLALYGIILKGAYSLVTVLQTMETV